MNVTFPSGVVSNLYTDIFSALTVDIESSLTDEELSITTNASSIRAFYTLAQGRSPRTLPSILLRVGLSQPSPPSCSG